MYIVLRPMDPYSAHEIICKCNSHKMDFLNLPVIFSCTCKIGLQQALLCGKKSLKLAKQAELMGRVRKFMFMNQKSSSYMKKNQI
jgi:hypothetical protein